MITIDLDDAPDTTGDGRRRIAALVASVGVSSVGDGMVLVAFPLLALRSTSDPLLVALVTVAGRLPGAVLALPAGVIADRLDRRRMVTAVNAVRAVVLVGYGAALATGTAGLLALYATVVVLGAGEVLVDVAVQATVPDVVARDRLPAVGGYLNGADVGGESLLGPALGGLLVGVAAWLPMVGDALSFVIGTVLARRCLPSGRRPLSPPSRLRHDLVSGLVLYRRTPALRTIAASVGALAACASAVYAVLVVFAAHRLHLGSAGYGLLLAGAAVGDVAGQVLAGRAWRRIGPAWSVLGAAGIAAGGYLLLSRATSFWPAAAILACEAFVVGVGNSAAVAVRQLATPEGMQGRSSAAYRVVVLGLLPLGALAGGAAAVRFGAATAIAGAGLVQIGVAVALARPLVRATADITA